MSFNKLKESRQNTLAKLNEEIQKLKAPAKFDSDDERYWYPQRDKTGNGSALIRFLPAPGEEDTPYVRLFSHSFQGPTGSWYIENSLTTIGKQDPVGEYNTKLWNTGLESDKEKARVQKRKLQYISNIYVIKDPANPENEGKVFLYKYGKKIFDKITDLMNPPDDGVGDAVEPINPFCLWNGANFKLTITTVDKFPNYDKSTFQKQGPLFDSDEKLEEVWSKEYSLAELVAPEKFKDYDVLKAKFAKVLGLEGDEVAEASPVKAPAVKKPPSPVLSSDGEDDLDKLFAELEGEA